jgi:flagellar capping protein FliD
MNTSLALYEALLQANVPAPAARRAAEALEADMTQHLATKQDLEHTNALMAKSFEAVNQRFESVDRRFEAVDKRFDSIDKRFDLLDKSLDVRFSTFEAKFDSRLDQQATRIVKTLGGIMAFLFAAIAGLQTFLR